MSRSALPLVFAAAIAASAMVSPSRTTLASSARYFVILVRGAMEGMSTVTGLPSSRPWYARASAWLPAEAATTPFFLCSGSSARRELRAPRSVKEPVACSHSCLR